MEINIEGEYDTECPFMGEAWCLIHQVNTNGFLDRDALIGNDTENKHLPCGMLLCNHCEGTGYIEVWINGTMDIEPPDADEGRD